MKTKNREEFTLTSDYERLNPLLQLLQTNNSLEPSNIGHRTSGNNSPIFGNITVNSSSELEMANLKVSYLEQIIKNKEELISLLRR